MVPYRASQQLFCKAIKADAANFPSMIEKTHTLLQCTLTQISKDENLSLQPPQIGVHSPKYRSAKQDVWITIEPDLPWIAVFEFIPCTAAFLVLGGSTESWDSYVCM